MKLTLANYNGLAFLDREIKERFLKGQEEEAIEENWSEDEEDYEVPGEESSHTIFRINS